VELVVPLALLLDRLVGHRLLLPGSAGR
jgi:hypothetical protein